VKAIVCSDWKRFNRGMLTFQGSHPQEVLGATLQSGDVIYLSPLLLEPQRDAARTLKHELCHALLYQNTTLQNSFRLARVHWLIEGLAVSNGNAEDYLSAKRWHARAVQGGYLFPIEADPHIERMPLSIGAPFMLSEYRFFIEFLRAWDAGAQATYYRSLIPDHLSRGTHGSIWHILYASNAI